MYSMCIKYIYIYIYIPYICIYIYIHIHVYIYIYICVERERERERARDNISLVNHLSYEEFTRLAETRLAQDSFNYLA